MKRLFVCIAGAGALVATYGSGFAGPVPDLVTFKPNTPAKAAEVNQNFEALKSVLNDNDARIEVLESTPLNDLVNMDEYSTHATHPTWSKTYRSVRWDSSGREMDSGTTVSSWVRTSEGSEEVTEGTWDESWDESWESGIRFRATYHYEVTDHGLWITGYTGENDTGAAVTEVSYENGLIVWPNGNWDPGRSWGGGYLERVYDSGSNEPPRTFPRLVVYQIVGTETLSVPAGTFEDCLVIVRTRGSRSDRVGWYAKGVGSVKYIYTEKNGFRSMYELVEYDLQQ